MPDLTTTKASSSLHPLTKMSLMLCLTTASMLFTNLYFMIPIATVATLFYALAARRTYLRAIPSKGKLHFVLVAGAFMLVAFNAVFASANLHSKHLLFVISLGWHSYEVTYDGILFGITAGLRYVTMFFSFIAFLLSTVPRDFSNALEILHCPVTISSVCALTFRFLATLEALVAGHWEAQKSRGLIRGKQPQIPFAMVYGTLLRNVLISTLMLAPRYSLILQIRGFGASPNRTHFRAYRLGWRDIFVLTMAFSGIFVAIYVRVVLHLGSFKPLS